MNAVALKTHVLDADGTPWKPTPAQIRSLWGGDAYKGSSYSRRAGALWHTGGGSADQDFLPEQRNLRARSRDQYRNNPVAKGAVDTLTTWVVGDGLQCRPQLQPGLFADLIGWSKPQVKRAQQLMLREWHAFFENRECDLERIGPDGYALQSLAFNSSLQSGDVLTLLPMVKRAPGAFETKIQLVEADRVSNPRGRMDSPQLKGGVRLDSNGAPLSYFVQESHPGEIGNTRPIWREILAFGRASGRVNAWLTYDRTRPGQTRGVPYLAACLEPLKQAERYTDAELMASVVGGSLTVAVKTQQAQNLDAGVSIVGQVSPEQMPWAMRNLFLDYGAFIPLLPNEDIVLIDPKRPNQAFGDFLRSVVEQIGVGLGMPFEILLKHFTASYSASRAAINEFWKYVRYRRWLFAQMWCLPIYAAVLTESILKGRLDLPGFLEDPYLQQAYLSSLWLGPSAGTLNPVQEITASSLAIKEGMSSLTREAAEIKGNNWEDVHQERVEEVETRRAAQLEAPLPAPQPTRSTTK